MRHPAAVANHRERRGSRGHCALAGGARKHLQTSNVIESSFATVRLRQRVTKGAGSRTKGLLMAYKLLDMTQVRWRRSDGAHLLPLVRANVSFTDGARAERRGKVGRKDAA